jgi:outer membrane protein
MRRITNLFLIGLLLMTCCNSFAQPMKFKLQEVVAMAKKNSMASLRAATLKENKYWQWRTFRSNYMPQLTLEGRLPDFNRNNIPVTQPDGTIQFQPIANDNSKLNLGIIQNIGLTGAQVSVSSNLLRFRDFDRKETRYNGNPLIIGFIQPLFAFNGLAWDKKTEPLRYEESQKKYTEDIEMVGLNASTMFFNLLIAQINQQIALKNRSNNDTLLNIGTVKYELGKLSRDELLQLKLGSLNAGNALAEANLNVESATFQLKSYIGFKEEAQLELILPEDLAVFDVDAKRAIAEARNNKYQTVEFRRCLLEARRDVAKAKGDNGLNANLIASFGLTNRAADIPGIYANPRDQQTLQIGFSVPIMDWGRSASKIKTAQANQKLVEYTVALDEINFDQEIYTQVRQFNMIRAQMQNNADADRTAQERYEISRNRYLLGDISITNLNIALQEKDQARRAYILSLKNFWDAYYNIRVLTLYDFERGKKIE